MNDFIEKKWFIFVKDKHEGPYSIDEVENKILQIPMPAETYVWKEGMSDWKVAASLPEFRTVLAKLKPDRNPTISVNSTNPATQGGFVEASPSSPTPEESAMPSDKKELGDNLDNKTGPSTHIQDPSSENSDTEISDPVSRNLSKSLSRRPPSWKLLIAIIPIVIIIMVFFQSYLNPSPPDDTREFKQTFMMSLAERFPFLTRWISILPPLEVSEVEYDELKSAASAKLDFSGPRFAMGLSRKDLLFPELYLASNLPDGAKIRVHIIGNPSTLLNWLTFEKETEVVLSKKLAKTGTIRFQDGKPIPRGEYVVSLSASENQTQALKNIFANATLISANLPAEVPKDLKILAFKTYFLGGANDAVYVARLKEFHDRLREKANRELSELKQFTATLENQFDSTTTKFLALREGRSGLKQKRLWANFHQEWIKLENSLNTIFNDWTPAVTHDQFFYGGLYQLVHQLGQAIDRVHSFQNILFTSTQDLKTLQIQIGESTAAAQGTLILVKSKIEQAEKIPPTVNGMPRTEGL